MGRGRGRAVILAALLVCMAFVAESQAAQYIVGGNRGWALPINHSWMSSVRFKSGDVLVFTYKRGVHDVARVSPREYRACRAGAGAERYSSGNDKVTLRKGVNYFLCSIPGHCSSGMKFTVNAV